MPQAFTPVIPTSAASANSKLALSWPLGSETRIIAGMYAAVQKLLDVGAVAARFVAGGVIGDAVARALVTLENDLLLNGVVTFAEPLEVPSVNASGNILADGVLEGGTINAGPGGVNATGRVRPTSGVSRAVVIGNATTAETASPLIATNYLWTSVTTGHTCTVDDTGAEDGDDLEFTSLETTGSGTYITLDGVGGSIQLKNASGFFRWVKFKRVSGSWRLIAGDRIP